MTNIPTRKDIKSVFAGLRPFGCPEDDSNATKEILDTIAGTPA